MGEPRDDDDRAMNQAALAGRGERARIGRAAGLLAALVLALGTAPALLEPWPAARALSLARGSGYAAFGLLLCALAVTPLGALARRAGARPPRLAVLRRALGMAAAWLALAHALLAFVGPLSARPSALLETSHLYAGMAALGILLLLLVTSFARVVRATRLRAWQELHRLSYVAALLVVQHVLLSPFSDPRLVLALCVLVAGLLASRLPIRARGPRTRSAPGDPRTPPGSNGTAA